jgi:hypothetical protein
MPKGRTGKRAYDPATNAILRKLAKRYGRNRLQHFRYDDPLGYVMSLLDYIRTFGTDRRYRAFIREDVVREFVQGLPRLPAWLERAA